ncbi:hypothetical protein BAUCODRAFT_220757 [Baudoinia panamericana UAMH 10762]|uniref:Uncharacterized protein n=1 Tax=Baudoinia panamericana (strain UAMH 10762) TaxID=717646 RepID=M2LIS9_BAUPA|nr:uncharacterized protein BAUCODRAFT_220757 [Baudoinia panamericana UAMH 10762]EMC94097.1 hypothetical protein BAUCODRAFT_220757 [Baudoinia panamericana UAMH 10762]
MFNETNRQERRSSDVLCLDQQQGWLGHRLARNRCANSIGKPCHSECCNRKLQAVNPIATPAHDEPLSNGDSGFRRVSRSVVKTEATPTTPMLDLARPRFSAVSALPLRHHATNNVLFRPA